jgi:hypothetical protein
MAEEKKTDTDLQPLSETGKPPKSRINSPKAAWDILNRMVKRDDQRSRKRAIIQGQIDGNPPYDENELKRLGQASRSNVNFRQAEQIRDKRKSSYYELVMEVETLVDIKTPKYSEAIRQALLGVENPDYGKIIAEEFTTMLRDWEDFLYTMFLHQEQLVVWGIGNCYWEDEVDWRFKAARVGSFLVPDETKSTIGDLDLMAIRTDYRVHELFEKVKDDETKQKSQDAGWDTELIIELLIASVNNSTDIKDNFQVGEWESLQQRIKDNDLYYTYAIQQKIKAAHVYVKEYNGKITHYIIPEDEEYNKDKNDNPRKFLFKKIDRYENWKNALRLFFLNIGEGTYHSVRGLGPKVFAACVLNDRMMNTMIDGGMAAATILLQPSNEAQKERIRLTRVGPFSVVPSGYNIMNHGSYQANINLLLGLKNVLDVGINRNVGLQVPDVIDSEKTPQARTLGEERDRITNEARLERGDITMYYAQLDSLFEEVLRRALNKNTVNDIDPGAKEARAFRKRCIDRGVPEDLLKPDQLKITAARAIGYGSPVMKGLISAEILSIAPYFDEVGKDNAVRDYVWARAGQRGVDRYKPIVNRNDVPTSEHTLAGLENNDHQEGTPTIVGIDQPHVIHLLVHMRPLMEIADAYIQGTFRGDLEQLYQYLTVALNHSAMHLDFMAQDPARVNEYNSYMEQFNQLVKLYSAVERQVRQLTQQRQAEAQAQQRAVQQAMEAAEDQKLQVELAKINADLQLRILKEQNNQQVREAKAIHGMRLKQALAENEIALKSAKAATG